MTAGVATAKAKLETTSETDSAAVTAVETREAAAQQKRKPIVAQGVDRGRQESTENLGTKK